VYQIILTKYLTKQIVFVPPATRPWPVVSLTCCAMSWNGASRSLKYLTEGLTHRVNDPLVHNPKKKVWKKVWIFDSQPILGCEKPKINNRRTLGFAQYWLWA
jgi:hypothetical protein